MSLKLNISASDVKPGVVYRAKYTDRLWRWDGETMWTRGAYDEIWHEAGWPHPVMTRKDIAYYLAVGEFEEVTE